MRYVDAIGDALREAMRRWPEVVLLGQDIAEYGGVFKVTSGFLEEFGAERVRNTPIIESGALGCALGLALGGYRPMVEMQFGDFITCGFNQIVNNLAKTHFRWGARVPVVIRVPVGGGVGAGPFHSQNVEAWFTSVAGLKVLAPATPADAKGLLLAAFEDGNPVLFLEHKFLYRSQKGRVPEGFYTLPEDLRVGDSGMWRQNAIVQLGFNPEGEGILFVGERHEGLEVNALFFAERGVRIPDELLYRLIWAPILPVSPPQNA